mmetsp:Transcript_28320/g.39833  ORF Transcript_28320/g.39833 Transcript_28320/m.39833 type:complete len:117 (+) Transcript_28320:210-560(+)
MESMIQIGNHLVIYLMPSTHGQDFTFATFYSSFGAFENLLLPNHDSLRPMITIELALVAIAYLFTRGSCLLASRSLAREDHVDEFEATWAYCFISIFSNMITVTPSKREGAERIIA